MNKKLSEEQFKDLMRLSKNISVTGFRWSGTPQLLLRLTREIFDEKNGHKLWKLFGHDLSEKEYKGLGDLIDSVSEEANKKGEVNKKSAFYRYFKRKAEDDPSLKGHYETLKRKNCFF